MVNSETKISKRVWFCMNVRCLCMCMAEPLCFRPIYRLVNRFVPEEPTIVRGVVRATHN